jgi:drug/metabolite transporter (DMT)-like permease
MNSKKSPKKSLWILTSAFALVCVLCWVAAYVINKKLSDLGTLPPPISQIVFEHSAWVLLLPLPWAIYSSVVSKRRELKPSHLFVFKGTLALAVVLSIVVTAIGCFLPWVVRYNGVA